MAMLASAQSRMTGTAYFVCWLLVVTLLMMERRIDFMDDGFRGLSWKFFDALDGILLSKTQRNGLLHMLRLCLKLTLLMSNM